MEGSDCCRRTVGGGVPFLFILGLLIILSMVQASWVDATGLKDTVPRVTPTRPPTLTPTPTLAPSPTWPPALIPTPTATATLAPGRLTPTATATLPPGQPTPTLLPSTATPQPPAIATPTVAQDATMVAVTATTTATLPPGQPTPTPLPLTATPRSPTIATPTSGADGGAATTVPTSVVPQVASAELLCLVRPSEAMSISVPDSRAGVFLPAGIATSPICLDVRTLDVASLPAPPAGYRLGSQAIQVAVSSLTGDALPGFAFTQPFSLTMRCHPQDLVKNGLGGPVIGFVGEASRSFAILHTESDATAALIASPRWAGRYAILVPVTVPKETAAGQQESPATPLAIGAGGLVAVVSVGAALVLVHRRPKRRQDKHGTS